MPLLKYRLDTGAIEAVIQGSHLDLTLAQRVPEDPTYGYVLAEAQHDPRTWQEHYYVVGRLVTPRDLLTLTATPNPVPSDGVTVCQITVEPFLPCTVRIHGTAYALTEADPCVLLTSDVPALFRVTLEAPVHAWADPLTVEARTDATP
jgi:hypothetical protein